MKKFFLFAIVLLLASCSAQKPNLVSTQEPILNIAANLAQSIEANAGAHSAWVKNKSQQPIAFNYNLYWYDENGITQLFSTQQEKYQSALLLQPQQKAEINLTKPTAESVNYRLYLFSGNN